MYNIKQWYLIEMSYETHMCFKFSSSHIKKTKHCVTKQNTSVRPPLVSRPLGLQSLAPHISLKIRGCSKRINIFGL